MSYKRSPEGRRVTLAHKAQRLTKYAVQPLDRMSRYAVRPLDVDAILSSLPRGLKVA